MSVGLFLFPELSRTVNVVEPLAVNVAIVDVKVVVLVAVSEGALVPIFTVVQVSVPAPAIVPDTVLSPCTTLIAPPASVILEFTDNVPEASLKLIEPQVASAVTVTV